MELIRIHALLKLFMHVVEILLPRQRLLEFQYACVMGEGFMEAGRGVGGGGLHLFLLETDFSIYRKKL